MTSLVSGLQRNRNHKFLLCPLGKMNAEMYIKSAIWTSESGKCKPVKMIKYTRTL